jgi:signal transduction histidine kinase
MTGIFWLDWAIIAVSLFNTILLLWMGLTVLLNANRRDWGVWLMGGGLLVATAFFISHSAILGQELALNFDGLNFWWRAGWFGVIVAPLAWYVAVLWFSGFWAAPQSGLRRRHRPAVWLMLTWLSGLLLLLLAANPIPAYDQLVQTTWGVKLALGSTPLAFLLFPFFMVACILLSIDALRRPAEVADANTAIARRRALPWLLAAAGTLLAVTLSAAFFIGSIVAAGERGELDLLRIETVAAYDLVLSLLIAAASLLVGQAIVAYEIFTGRVLPRRSFVRHWRYAILLAGSYAAVVGWSIAIDLRPIYSLLLATLLLTSFYALYVWRAFREREQFVARLRPFVQTAGAMQGPLPTSSSAGSLFEALCRDLLGTAAAQLVPLGSVAPLVPAPLCYGTAAPPAEAVRALSLAHEPAAGVAPLSGRAGPYRWVIPLWDAREQIGTLLIGEKLDGGLYSQEEMETAQAAGERVIQLLASEQITVRLMELQRKRTTAQRVMDQRTRRALHDDILPALHLAILQLSGADRRQHAVEETLQTLTETHKQIADLLTSTQPAPTRAPDSCELVTALHALAADEFADSFEEIGWSGVMVTGAADSGKHALTLYVEPVVAEVVLGAARETMRNAAAHGRGDQAERPLRLDIGLDLDDGNEELVLTIADNGVGIGFEGSDSTSDAAAPHGGGHGLALHSTLLAMVGGYLTIASAPLAGTRVQITVPYPDSPQAPPAVLAA